MSYIEGVAHVCLRRMRVTFFFFCPLHILFQDFICLKQNYSHWKKYYSFKKNVKKFCRWCCAKAYAEFWNLWFLHSFFVNNNNKKKGDENDFKIFFNWLIAVDLFFTFCSVIMICAFENWSCILLLSFFKIIQLIDFIA